METCTEATNATELTSIEAAQSNSHSNNQRTDTISRDLNDKEIDELMEIIDDVNPFKKEIDPTRQEIKANDTNASQAETNHNDQFELDQTENISNKLADMNGESETAANNQLNTNFDITNDVNPNLLNKLDSDIQFKLQNIIKTHLMYSAHFWIRILILILAIILILLSLSYTFGAVSSTQLILIDHCAGHSIEEIWRHSAAVGQEKGVQDSCWTTRTLTIDEDAAYSSNRYKYKSRHDGFAIFQCVVFSLFTVYCVLVFVYGACLLIVDVMAIQQHKLYHKAPKFKSYLKRLKSNSSAHIHKTPNVVMACFAAVKSKYDLYFGVDTYGNVARMIVMEVWEVMMQTLALLLYNGFNVWDADTCSITADTCSITVPPALELSALHFRATEMKLFSWLDIGIMKIDDAISNWGKLEFFELQRVDNLTAFPSSFSKLTNLKAFLLANVNNLSNFTQYLCAMTELLIVQLRGTNDAVIPHCFGDLINLQRLGIQANHVRAFPLGILNLTKLESLDLWNNLITYDQILEYNNFSNDSDPFKYYINSPTETDVFLSGKICATHYLQALPKSFQIWTNKRGACGSGQCAQDGECAAYGLGNGICIDICNIAECDYDKGDCYQFCFTKTQCSIDSYLNDICDEECNNEECAWDNGRCKNATVVPTKRPAGIGSVK